MFVLFFFACVLSSFLEYSRIGKCLPVVIFFYHCPFCFPYDQVTAWGKAVSNFVNNSLPVFMLIIKQQIAAKYKIEITVNTRRGAVTMFVQQIKNRKINVISKVPGNSEVIALLGKISINSP